MDQEFRQMDIVKCKQHPQMVISYIFCKQNCPYPSRFACAKCVKEYKTLEGFEEVLEVLNDPRVIMNSSISLPNGIYSQLNSYFDLLDQDPDYFLHSFKQDIMQQIHKLENDLKEGIEKYKQFIANVAKVHQQLKEALGLEQLRQTFKDILKVENYHQSQKWKDLEDTVQNFLLQFEEQKNQELNESYYKLKQMEQTFLQRQELENFKGNVSKSVESLCQKLKGIEVKGFSSSLCNKPYCWELIQIASKNKNVEPKVSLLFKASEHGMNAQAFWGKCSNQGPTIVICKSKNGYVFGGYTPCKWIPNGDYQKDDSKTSFLFSYTRKEVYPIQDVNYAIYCASDYGPTFGGHPNLYIAADFQYGYSLLDNTYYQDQQYEIENSSTHLMGSETPQLVEMEVFLIKWE